MKKAGVERKLPGVHIKPGASTASAPPLAAANAIPASLTAQELATRIVAWAQDLQFRPAGRYITAAPPTAADLVEVCRGGAMHDIWSHLLTHVRPRSVVSTVTQNLKLAGLMSRQQQSERDEYAALSAAQTQLRTTLAQTAEETRALRRETAALTNDIQATLTDAASGGSGASAVASSAGAGAGAGGSVDSLEASISEHRQRQALLNAYSQRVRVQIATVREYERRIRLQQQQPVPPATATASVEPAAAPATAASTASASASASATGSLSAGGLIETPIQRAVREWCQRIQSRIGQLSTATAATAASGAAASTPNSSDVPNPRLVKPGAAAPSALDTKSSAPPAVSSEAIANAATKSVDLFDQVVTEVERDATDLWRLATAPGGSARFLSALCDVTTANVSQLRSTIDSIDLRSEARALKYAYEHPTDMSRVTDLNARAAAAKTLKNLTQLMQTRRDEHIARFEGAEKAKNEAFDLTAKLNELRDRERKDDTATDYILTLRRLQDTELEVAAQRAVLALSESTRVQLESTRDQLRAGQIELRAKHATIQQFDSIKVRNENAIRALIRANRIARDRLGKAQDRIHAYVRDNLCAVHNRIAGVIAPASAASALPSLADSEFAIADRLSLVPFASAAASADHVSGGTRVVPVTRLGIHSLSGHSPFARPLLAALGLPAHSSTDALVERIVAINNQIVRMELEVSRARTAWADLKRNDRACQRAAGVAVDIHNPTDMNNVLIEVQRIDTLQSVTWTQQLNGTLKEADAIAGVECEQTRQALDAWLRQPAQYVVPWIHVDGLNLQSWVERWRKCCFELRELEQQNRNRQTATAAAAAAPIASASASGSAAPAFGLSPSKMRL